MTELDEIRSRGWCLTINNYTEAEWDACINEECEFSVFAPEIGDSGTKHIQGYIYYKNPKKFKTMKKNWKRAHLEVPKGSAEENLKYIQGPYEKNGKQKPYNPDAIVFGTCPKQGSRSDLEVVKERLKETGRMRDVVTVATSYQSVRMAECILKYHELPRTEKPFVRWFWGPTGTGKSKTAYELLGEDCYTCMSTAKWFEGYDGHTEVLIDDMRKDFCKFHELLRLLDRYQMRIECKGGSRQFRATHIIITSCYSPQTLFDTREDVQQLIRRIDEIKEFGHEEKYDWKADMMLDEEIDAGEAMM